MNRVRVRTSMMSMRRSPTFGVHLSSCKDELVFAGPGRYIHFPSIPSVAVVAGVVELLPLHPESASLICRVERDLRAVVQLQNC